MLIFFRFVVIRLADLLFGFNRFRLTFCYLSHLYSSRTLSINKMAIYLILKQIIKKHISRSISIFITRQIFGPDQYFGRFIMTNTASTIQLSIIHIVVTKNTIFSFGLIITTY